MKSILIPLFIFTCLMGYSQWEMGSYVDEFGANTGKIYAYQEVRGVRSKNKLKSSCRFYIEHNKTDQTLTISIYPFEDERMEHWKEDTFQNFQLITPKGKRVYIETFCFDSMMYFSEKEYKELVAAMQVRGKYKALCTYDDGKSITSYAFNFQN